MRLKKLERGTIPMETATDMLLKARTSRERKTAWAARETVWIPEELAAEADEQISVIRRLKRGKAAQIVRWFKRIVSRRSKLQRDYTKTQERLFNLEKSLELAVEGKFEVQQRILQSQINTLLVVKEGLDSRAQVFDSAWEAIEESAEQKGMKL